MISKITASIEDEEFERLAKERGYVKQVSVTELVAKSIVKVGEEWIIETPSVLDVYKVAEITRESLFLIGSSWVSKHPVEYKLSEITILDKYKDAEEPKPNFGRVKPEAGQQYWVLSSGGTTRTYHWKNDSVDKRAWAMGNVHLTGEAAELVIARQQAKFRVIDKLAELRNVELDWTNKGQNKHRLGVNHFAGKIFVDGHTHWQSTKKELYSTKEACEWVAENMADDVKLMLTGEK